MGHGRWAMVEGRLYSRPSPIVPPPSVPRGPAVKEPLVRFSVAIGGELLDRFDRYREEHRYPNRSEAVRGLMRAALIEDAVAADDGESMGVVTLIYDHHVGRAAERLTELQHLHLDRVVAAT